MVKKDSQTDASHLHNSESTESHLDTNPYRSPASFSVPQQSPVDMWSVWSARTIRLSMLSTATYAALVFIAFLTVCYGLTTNSNASALAATIFITIHAALMVLNAAAFLFTVRDWRFREFKSPATKYWWLAAIAMTGGVGWIWYIMKFKLWHSPICSGGRVQ